MISVKLEGTFDNWESSEIASPFEYYYVVGYEEQIEDALDILSLHFPVMACIETKYATFMPGYARGSHIVAPISADYFLTRLFTSQLWRDSGYRGKHWFDYKEPTNPVYKDFILHLGLYKNGEYLNRICKGCTNYIGKLGGECSLGSFTCATNRNFGGSPEVQNKH